MKRLIFILGMNFLFTAIFAQHKIVATTTADSSALPAGLKYPGKLKQAVRWTDSRGINLVIETETGNYHNSKFKHDLENEGLDAELFAFHYIIHNSFRQSWRAYDFVQDCPFDIEAGFIKNSLQVTDLNKDGVGEVWIVYKIVCHSDVSTAEMKIIMYQGDKKFALRGRDKVRLSKTETEGGECSFDQAFKDGPALFREYALNLWNENVIHQFGQ